MSAENMNKSTDFVLQDFLRVFLVRRWTILATFLFVVVFISIYILTRSDRFQAAATFIIDPQELNFSSPRGMGFVSQNRPIEFYRALIESRSFRSEIMKVAQKDSALTTLSGFSQQTLEKILKENVSLKPSEYTELVTLSVITHDPDFSYRLATLLIDEFKERCRQIEQEESKNIVDFVQQQTDISQQKLEQTERALQEFKEKTNITALSEKAGEDVLQHLAELENNLAEIQTQKELSDATLRRYQERLQELRGSAAGADIEQQSPVANQLRQEIRDLNNQMVSLVERSGPDAPGVRQLEEQLKGKRDQYISEIRQQSHMPSAAGYDQSSWNQIQQNIFKEEINKDYLQNREWYYEQLIENYRKQNPNMLEHAIELSRLQRQKDVADNLYKFLIERGEEAAIQAATGTGGIRIIEYPMVPQKPIPKSFFRKLILAMFFGLALGVGLALLQEYTDTSIRNSSDIDRYLDLPHLGSIPNINSSMIRSSNGKASGKEPEPAGKDSNGFYRYKLISSLRPRDVIFDTYRDLRTNIHFSTVDQNVQSILVTSAVPGEGKTVTVANLALILSELGQSSLIIDCDLRKPKQHTLFNVNQMPGLTEHLIKDLPLEKVIRPTDSPHVSLLTCGTLPPNPTEMIVSKKMAYLLEEVRRQFDYIILDSPPIGVVTDPLLLAERIKNVLLVIRFGSTKGQTISHSIQRLSKSRANILGVVLNNVRSTMGYDYYDRYKYYNDYYSETSKHKRA